MSDFHLIGDWDDSVDPELEALKGFVVLHSLAYRSPGFSEISWGDECSVHHLISKLVDDLEKRLRELDGQIQKMQTNVA